MKVKVIGAGLAGSEAAWQLANRGIEVALYEGSPKDDPRPPTARILPSLSAQFPAGRPAEKRRGRASQEELRRCGSLILACADATRVEAGGCLAVDRGGFSPDGYGENPESPQYHGDFRRNHRSPRGPVIVATGPLTSDALSEPSGITSGETGYLHFLTHRPLVSAESIDMNLAWWQSRYDRERRLHQLRHQRAVPKPVGNRG